MDSYHLTLGIIWLALFFLVSGPVHECAHAFAAWKLGDGTAKLFGRVTLWPAVHFDPVGGGLMILSVVVGVLGRGGGAGFGWAKPTPVNPYSLRGRYANAMVSAAGPLSNLVLAALFALGFRALWAAGFHEIGNQSIQGLVQLVMVTGVALNIVLMLFNFIPVPPLDGSRVLLDVLDPRTSRQVGAVMDQYGLLLLFAAVIFAGQLIRPFFVPIVNFLLGMQVYL